MYNFMYFSAKKQEKESNPLKSNMHVIVFY